jgi:hypothetical protein
MTSRLIRAPKFRGLRPGTDMLVNTQWLHGEPGTDFHEIHEHVILETPKPITDTQRMRLLQTWESDKLWRTT